jgi:hypothetical protein
MVSRTNVLRTKVGLSPDGWVSHSDEFELKYDSSAFNTKNIHMLNYLHSEQNVILITCSEHLIFMLSQSNEVDILNFWYEHRALYGFQYSPDIIDTLTYGNSKSLDWWLTRYHEFGDLYYTSDAIDSAACTGCLDVWFKHRHSVEMKYTSESIGILHKNIVNWWISKKR